MRPLLLSTLLATACGDDSGGGTGKACAGQPVMLSGSFAAQLKFVSDVTINGLADDKALESQFLAKMDFAQNGTALAVTTRICRINLAPIPVNNQPNPLTLTFDPATVDSIAPVMSNLTLSSATGCADVHPGIPAAVLIGLRAKAPLTDPLPTFDNSTGAYVKCGGTLAACSAVADPASGACVCDQENDTKPAATVNTMNAPAFPRLDKVYAGIRVTLSLAGKMVTEDELSGNLTATIVQAIYGCHQMGDATDCPPGMVGGLNAFVPMNSQSDPTMHPSTWTAKRVTAATDCATIRAMFP